MAGAGEHAVLRLCTEPSDTQHLETQEDARCLYHFRVKRRGTFFSLSSSLTNVFRGRTHL